MRQSLRNPSRQNRAFERVRAAARVALQLVVLGVVALLPAALPSFGLLVSGEFESPVDQDESSLEAALNTQARARLGHDEPGSPLRIPARARPGLPRPGIPGAPVAGHRFSNHLLAPLRL